MRAENRKRRRARPRRPLGAFVRNDIAKQFPGLALEPGESKGLDWIKVRSTRVDGDARQQHRNTQAAQVGSLLHDVGAGKVVAATLQNFDKRCRDGVSVDV